jgi:hypothetical protein
LHDLAADLDEDVMDLATTLYPKSQGYQLMPVLRDGRDVGFRVSAPAWRTEVSCVSGSNMRYVNGKEMRYFSYSVHAESVIPGVLKAEKFARELASWLAIAFAIVFCVLFFFACQALADFLDLGVLLVPAALFAIFLVHDPIAGRWLATTVGLSILSSAKNLELDKEPTVVKAGL